MLIIKVFSLGKICKTHKVPPLLFIVLLLMFIVLLPPYVVSITPTPTLSYRLEFCWRRKVSGCKALAKTFALQVCLFFPQTCMIFFPFYIENNVSIICLDLFVHCQIGNIAYNLKFYLLLLKDILR